MRLLLIGFILFIPLKNLSALENKIVTKIENEIITTIDIENEKNYLKALNPNIRNIDEDRLNLISKNSLIKEKIKENEILKYTDKINLDEKFLDGLVEKRYSRLTVQPNIWFGFKCISDDDALLLNISNILHSPDEVQRKDLSCFEFDVVV